MPPETTTVSPKDLPPIRRSDRVRARVIRVMFPIVFGLRSLRREVEFATKKITRPHRISIPTRHGRIRALVYAPTPEDLAGLARQGRRPPVHLLIHAGGFIIRSAWQEGNVARYIASEQGTVVIVPDYDTTPKVRWPVAEEESYDTYRWILDNGADHGWDTSRVTIGGASAGSKIAMSVVALAIDDGVPTPIALTSAYGVADLSRPDEGRTSPLERPFISADLMRLVRNTYFLGVDLTDPGVSVALHPRLPDFPPTLILTGELDAVRHEMNEFAANLIGLGVEVTHRQFPGVDHGFTHTRPVEIAREAILSIGDHLRRAHDSIR